MAGYKFPDELDNDNVDNKEAPDNEVEVEIVDDTPVKDRGREPLNREVADPTDEEISSYSDGVQKRIKELTHARHDERRAKEALLREKKELERLAEHMANENKKLKAYVQTGSEQYAESIKKVAENDLESAKRKYKEA